jgi:hypothetical protein
VVFAARGASEEYLGSLRRIAAHFADSGWFLVRIGAFDSSAVKELKLSGEIVPGLTPGGASPCPYNGRASEVWEFAVEGDRGWDFEVALRVAAPAILRLPPERSR